MAEEIKLTEAKCDYCDRPIKPFERRHYVRVDGDPTCEVTYCPDCYAKREAAETAEQPPSCFSCANWRPALVPGDHPGWCSHYSAPCIPTRICKHWVTSAPTAARQAIDPADLAELARQGLGEIQPIPPEQPPALTPEEVLEFHRWRVEHARPIDDCKDPAPRTTDPQSSHYAIPGLDLELYDLIRAGATPEELIGYLRWSIFERVWRLRRKGGDAGARSDATKIVVQARWLVEACEALDAP